MQWKKQQSKEARGSPAMNYKAVIILSGSGVIATPTSLNRSFDNQLIYIMQ